jgi:putative transposase
VEYIVNHYDLNVRRACRLIKQTRSVQYYRRVKDPRHDLRSRMREIAQARVRYGYRRIHVLLKRDGWQLGKNQMYRLYCEERLQLRSKLPKRR